MYRSFEVSTGTFGYVPVLLGTYRYFWVHTSPFGYVQVLLGMYG